MRVLAAAVDHVGVVGDLKRLGRVLLDLNDRALGRREALGVLRARSRPGGSSRDHEETDEHNARARPQATCATTTATELAWFATRPRNSTAWSPFCTSPLDFASSRPCARTPSAPI